MTSSGLPLAVDGTRTHPEAGRVLQQYGPPLGAAGPDAGAGAPRDLHHLRTNLPAGSADRRQAGAGEPGTLCKKTTHFTKENELEVGWYQFIKKGHT